MGVKSYIVVHDGITLPNYKRDAIKKGVVVELDEKIGEGYCKRGFLLDAKQAAKADPTAKLKAENEALKLEVADLKAENDALAKAAKAK